MPAWVQSGPKDAGMPPCGGAGDGGRAGQESRHGEGAGEGALELAAQRREIQGAATHVQYAPMPVPSHTVSQGRTLLTRALYFLQTNRKLKRAQVSCHGM